MVQQCINRFHITSWQTSWCFKTKKRRPRWSTQNILRKFLKFFSHVKTSFVAVYNLGKNEPYYVSSSVQKFICLMMS